MQPPLVQASLVSELRQLKAHAEAATHVKTGVPQTSVVDDYTQRIHAWVSRMTPQQRKRRFTSQEVMALAALQGRFRPAPSAQCTGAALRRCGFTSRRDWTVAGRNTRYWIYEGTNK